MSKISFNHALCDESMKLGRHVLWTKLIIYRYRATLVLLACCHGSQFHVQVTSSDKIPFTVVVTALYNYYQLKEQLILTHKVLILIVVSSLKKLSKIPIFKKNSKKKGGDNSKNVFSVKQTTRGLTDPPSSASCLILADVQRIINMWTSFQQFRKTNGSPSKSMLSVLWHRSWVIFLEQLFCYLMLSQVKFSWKIRERTESGTPATC